ncbi:hypothetical protein [Nocardioides ochotonae]|uniref:hypothetical protein n=1 Tax=Nocardioides ochotonae TaxID=2685869 RepID=UPI00140841A2|nr:hypothetical protein [Nocardioides ochotonae]
MSNDSIPPDWDTPATRADLRWWLDLAPTLRWTWAKTYADFAPHWYVRGGGTPGFTRDDSRRVGRVVRTFGEPGKFWKRTNLYLFTEDRARKFWCMFGEVPKPPGIVNLAHATRVYGPQTDFDEQRLTVLRLGGER